MFLVLLIFLFFSCFVAGWPNLGFAALFLVLIFLFTIPILKFLSAKRHKITKSEYFFETNSFKVKVGPYTSSIEIDHIWRIYVKKNYLKISLKRGELFILTDDAETFSRVSTELENDPIYKKYLNRSSGLNASPN